MQHWIQLLNTFKEQHKPVALITVVKCLGSAPCEVGSRMLVTKDRTSYGTIGGGKLEFLAIDQAIEALNTHTIIETTYTLGPEFEQCCGGKVDLLIEPMNQSPELFLFGAGHIGVEIAKLLVDTPFQVYLIDSRDNWLEDIVLDDCITKRHVKTHDFKTFKDAVHWGVNCYVLVLTHDHTIDFDVIAMAIQQETNYVGLIGSKTKRVRFHNMLVNELGIKEGLDTVVCPIGLPLGGNTPKEIAISVAAQLLQVHYND